jgi:DNA-binding GntR family transcriptional regulator
MPTDATRAYALIKEKIINLELAPGTVINDAVLTEEFGFGRTPIREALKLLEAERLVVTVPRRGIFVAHVSITDLQQISEVRVELEGLATRLAVERATAGELAGLRACLDAAAGNGESGSAETRLAQDRKLHQLLAAAAHNKFLESEIERFYDLSARLWYLAIERLPAHEVDVLSHQQILDALEQRDVERAERLMREHIRNFQRTVKKAI